MQNLFWLIIVTLFVYLFFKFSIAHLAGIYSFSRNSLSPLSVGAKKLILSAFDNLPCFVDYHLHLVALGDESKGWVNPKMQSILHPIQRLQFELYRQAAGIVHLEQANQEYIQRVITLKREMPAGKIYLLAMDKRYSKDGNEDSVGTPFFVNNDYVWQTAATYPDFIPMISIHPYRKDAIAQLHHWRQKGVRYIKWLPNSMGIDPSDKKIEAFYSTVKQLEMVILTHTGVEEAIEVVKGQFLGNPLLLERPLEMGVKMIMAHVGSLGKCVDLHCKTKTNIPCFELTLRMLDDPRFKENLFADISGITLINRGKQVLKKILAREDLYSRLVYGSDYPISAVNMLVQTFVLAKNGFITFQERKALSEIYRQNPLLFDLVLKRTLKLPGTTQCFPAYVFGPHPLLPS